MRRIIPLLIATALAGCAAAPPAPNAPLRSPSGQRAYQNLFAGKVPQAPVNCVPQYNANDMSVIDGRTLAFRVGSGFNTVYMVHLTPGCENVANGPYALVSRSFGGGGLCTGDIQQVTDTMANSPAGSCSVAAIIPYARPGR